MKITVWLIMITLCVSCININENHDRADIRLLLPDSVLHIDAGEMQLLATDAIVHRSSPSIITVIWGDCYVCMKKFREWENLRQMWSMNEVQMVYVVTTDSPEYFLRVFYPEIEYNGLLLVDNTYAFYSLNSLQQEASHQNTFLVDSTFRIILQGDPLLIPSLQERYKEAINKICKR